MSYSVFGAGCKGSNPRHPPYRGGALPTELTRHIMERRGRFELPTNWFEANRSIQTELTTPCLARPVGFEPTTPRLEASCSIQMSYGRRNYVLRRRLNGVRKVVCAAGFEPATPRFQAENSDHAELRTVILGRGRGGVFMMWGIVA